MLTRDLFAVADSLVLNISTNNSTRFAKFAAHCMLCDPPPRSCRCFGVLNAALAAHRPPTMSKPWSVSYYDTPSLFWYYSDIRILISILIVSRQRAVIVCGWEDNHKLDGSNDSLCAVYDWHYLLAETGLPCAAVALWSLLLATCGDLCRMTEK